MPMIVYGEEYRNNHYLAPYFQAIILVVFHTASSLVQICVPRPADLTEVFREFLQTLRIAWGSVVVKALHY